MVGLLCTRPPALVQRLLSYPESSKPRILTVRT
jgi:hypothetical protein